MWLPLSLSNRRRTLRYTKLVIISAKQQVHEACNPRTKLFIYETITLTSMNGSPVRCRLADMMIFVCDYIEPSFFFGLSPFLIKYLLQCVLNINVIPLTFPLPWTACKIMCSTFSRPFRFERATLARFCTQKYKTYTHKQAHIAHFKNFRMSAYQFSNVQQ